MLKLKSLEFEKIGRFVDKQKISFDGLGNLIQVDAINTNTGGKSGVGKSTVFNASDYLLGINDLPVSVLQTRGIEEGGIFVSGLFDWDGAPVTVTRSKAKGLIIELPGETIAGSNKLAEEKLDEMLGMPRHLFRKIMHQRQKMGGFFLEFTPKQTHEFLIDCRGLGVYKEKVEKIDNKIKDLSEQKESLDRECLSANSAYSATQDAILSLGLSPIQDMHKETVLRLKEKMDRSKESLRKLDIEQKLELEKFELTRPMVQITPFDQSTLAALDEQKESLVKQISLLEKQEKDRQISVNKQLSDLTFQKIALESNIEDGVIAHKQAIDRAYEIKKIREHICPTCEQTWLHDSSKTKEKSLMAELEQLKVQIQKGKESKEKLISLQVTINELNEERKEKINPEIVSLTNKWKESSDLLITEKKRASLHNDSENRKQEAVYEEFYQKSKQFREQLSLIRNQYLGQVEVDTLTFEAALNKLKTYEQAKKRYEENVQTLSGKSKLFNDKIQELSIKIKELNDKLELSEEAKRAIKSYISHCFDDSLETIGEKATHIIRNIPNMATATITLESTKETKEGKVKEEVTAVLHVDGELNVPIKSLSGGERSAVDLAVDLAVIDFIEDSTGKGIDIFILDEPFQGLGEVEIEMALEIIKNENLNRRIILVDHNPIVKEMVSDTILVVRDGTISKIERQ